MPKWLRRLEWCLNRYRWYRRWHGGRWELWWVDVPVCADIWHPITRPHWERPTALCRGTPIVEGVASENGK